MAEKSKEVAMRVKRDEEDGYLTWRGRGKPITPEEIKACAAAFSVGDCISIFLKESKVLFGKVVTKTSHFLQIKEYRKKGTQLRTFVYSDFVLMKSKIKRISEQEMMTLVEKMRKKRAIETVQTQEEKKEGETDGAIG